MKRVYTIVLVITFILFSTKVYSADKEVVLKIEGMDCPICAIAIKRSLKKTKGVKKAKVSFEKKKAWVVVEENTPVKALLDAVKRAGPYSAEVINKTSK